MTTNSLVVNIQIGRSPKDFRPSVQMAADGI